MPTLFEVSMHMFLQLAVILAVYRLLWPLFKKLGQVQVVAIMFAGFLLGPSLLGLVWPAGQEWLFPSKVVIDGVSIPHPSNTAIYVVGQLGLVVYMFLVGTAFKVDIFRGHMGKAASMSIAGIGVPLVLGISVGWYMVVTGGYFPDKVGPLQGGLFVAAAVCIAAFPMLAWIVYDTGLLKTRLGTMALACAAADDAFAWIMLAVVVATTKGTMGGAVLAVVGGLGYLVFMLTIGKRGLRQLSKWADKHSPLDQLPVGPLAVTLMVVLLGAWFTDYVGIYAVFGAFIVGTVMPRGRMLDVLRERLEPLTAYLLVPAFFIYSGLNTKLSLLFEPAVLTMMLVVLLISFVGKFGAITLTARWRGMSWRESGSLGSLMNARGLMELILLNVGLTAGIVTPTLYTILALMTIITTFVATPMHRMFVSQGRRRGLVYGPDGEQPITSAETDKDRTPAAV